CTAKACSQDRSRQAKETKAKEGQEGQAPQGAGAAAAGHGITRLAAADSADHFRFSRAAMDMRLMQLDHARRERVVEHCAADAAERLFAWRHLAQLLGELEQMRVRLRPLDFQTETPKRFSHSFPCCAPSSLTL